MQGDKARGFQSNVAAKRERERELDTMDSEKFCSRQKGATTGDRGGRRLRE